MKVGVLPTKFLLRSARLSKTVPDGSVSGDFSGSELPENYPTSIPCLLLRTKKSIWRYENIH
ncbi:hypothetical protein [Chryseobacterium sp.]|uniref:hypothetical protein n=1 Tax=Chryseobacterium sp. TaxID=1871047 RepID=UPI00333E1D97